MVGHSSRCPLNWGVRVGKDPADHPFLYKMKDTMHDNAMSSTAHRYRRTHFGNSSWVKVRRRVQAGRNAVAVTAAASTFLADPEAPARLRALVASAPVGTSITETPPLPWLPATLPSSESARLEAA